MEPIEIVCLTFHHEQVANMVSALCTLSYKLTGESREHIEVVIKTISKQMAQAGHAYYGTLDAMRENAKRLFPE